MVARYRASDTGVVCNGLYRLMGDRAFPRLPSVEDYARLLVPASGRLGPERTAPTFGSWIEEQPIPTRQCFLLKGVIIDRRLSPRGGLVLKTLSGNGEGFPRSLYVQLDAADIRYEQNGRRTMLSLEHEVGPVLYFPDGEKRTFLSLLQFPESRIRNCRGYPQRVSAGQCRSKSTITWIGFDAGGTTATLMHPSSTRAVGHFCSRRAAGRRGQSQTIR